MSYMALTLKSCCVIAARAGKILRAEANLYSLIFASLS